MENKENNIELNVNKTNKKNVKTSILIALVMVLMLVVGIGVGIFISDNKKEKENCNNTNNTENTIKTNNAQEQDEISEAGTYDRAKRVDEVKKSVSNNSKKESNSTYTNTYKEYAEEYIKIIDKIKSENPDAELTADLIYFNNDSIPDLVIGVQGYWVSLYIYEDGKIYNPIDEWPYGIGASKYYDYIEKKGVAHNYGNGYAGAISYNTYYLLNSNKEVDELYSIGEGVDMEPTDSMYEQVQKELAESAGYYYKGKIISEEEFNNKLKEASVSANDKDYKELVGSKLIDEVKKELQKQ